MTTPAKAKPQARKTSRRAMVEALPEPAKGKVWCFGYVAVGIDPHQQAPSKFPKRKGVRENICKDCSREGRKAQRARKDAAAGTKPKAKAVPKTTAKPKRVKDAKPKTTAAQPPSKTKAQKTPPKTKRAVKRVKDDGNAIPTVAAA